MTDLQARATRRSRWRLAATILVGAVAFAAALTVRGVTAAIVAGWGAASLLFVSWTWLAVGPLGPAATAAHATREGPTRRVTDVLLLLASVAGLVAVVSVGHRVP